MKDKSIFCKGVAVKSGFKYKSKYQPLEPDEYFHVSNDRKLQSIDH